MDPEEQESGRRRPPEGDGGDARRPGEEAGERAAWIPVVGPAGAEGELAEAYREIGASEGAAHVIALHSLHPAAMVDHVRLYRTLMFGPSPLSRVEREAIAVVVSDANDCFY